jgi:hypothetical protein
VFRSAPEREGSVRGDEAAQHTARLLDVRSPYLGARDARRLVGVGVFLHESLGALVFAACLLTLAVAFWLWILRRLTR